MKHGLWPAALGAAAPIGLAGAHESRPGTAPRFQGSVSTVAPDLRARMSPGTAAARFPSPP